MPDTIEGRLGWELCAYFQSLGGLARGVEPLPLVDDARGTDKRQGCIAQKHLLIIDLFIFDNQECGSWNWNCWQRQLEY
jgi:hypothetical protein